MDSSGVSLKQKHEYKLLIAASSNNMQKTDATHEPCESQAALGIRSHEVLFEP